MDAERLLDDAASVREIARTVVDRGLTGRLFDAFIRGMLVGEGHEPPAVVRELALTVARQHRDMTPADIAIDLNQLATQLHREAVAAAARPEWPGGAPVVKAGDRVRVTRLTDVREALLGACDAIGVAGTAVVGTAANVDPDGYFDLYPDQGVAACLYAGDDCIRIEVLRRAGE